MQINIQSITIYQRRVNYILRILPRSLSHLPHHYFIFVAEICTVHNQFEKSF
ncbi:hypothetical protein [Adhaeribacter radiodurans]|uniref:Uncharacterized protein n=1 Tax=Adhaeribacter radiodurans TaxID=2745197 RepID=A0A7L7LA15_9BACT|nr:hypothetical protein [Adhaeribacter radiodurans]QMU29668.1 hypothetical protein HUW48_17255 [Adhaeribacter radiodurans]